MVGCSAINCSNRSDNGFKTYRIPRDPVRRQAWISVIGREGWIPGDGAAICEAHFEESAYELHRADGLKKLKQNAVPTISVASSTSRRKRKQTVQPKAEYSFNEGGGGPVGTEKSLVEDHVQNEVFPSVSSYAGGVSGMDERFSEMKGLKTVHIMEIINKPKPKEMDVNAVDISEFGVIEETDCNSNSKQMESEGNDKVVPVAMVKVSWQCNNKGRVKSGKKQRQDIVMKNVIEPEVVELDGEGSGHLGASSGDPGKSMTRCFVCNKVIAPGFDVHLNIPAEASRTILRDFLEAVLNFESSISDHEVLCRRCCSLLNYIDRTEAEVALIKGAISVCAKHDLEDKFKVTKSEQLLERFSRGVGEKNYVMDLEELFLVQTDGENNDKEINGYSVAVEESMSEEVNNSAEDSEKVAENADRDVNEDSSEIDGLEVSKAACQEPEYRQAEETSALIRDSSDSDENESNSKSLSLENAVCTDDFKEYLGGKQKTHECKICSFKTEYESVMIWHLRGHMKSHRWCDFCCEAIPEKENLLTKFKKMKSRVRPSMKKTCSKPKVILPAIPVEATSKLQVHLSSLNDISSESPVVLVDTQSLGSEIVQETEVKDSESMKMEGIQDGGVVFMSENVLSETTELPQSLLPVTEGTASALELSESDKMKNQTENFCYDSTLISSVQETEALEIICSVLRTPGIELEKVDNPDIHGECLSNCCDVNESNSVDSLSGDPCNIPSGECAHPTEDLEDSMETNFLVTLSSQPVAKYPAMLSEICDEGTNQDTVSPFCDVPDDNMSSNDDHFSQSNAIGESDLALAYENSVAALMCQSDDSDEMLY